MRESFLERLDAIFHESILVHEQSLAANREALLQAVEVIVEALQAGNKILIFGNGGSAADSQHMAAELIGRFQQERASFSALALTTDTSILTALGNDYGYDTVFARQIEGLGRTGDVALAISTSGNANNVLRAVQKAKELGLKTIALSGKDGGKLAPLTDLNILAASTVTARIQETHICMIHAICEMVENRLGQGGTRV